MLTTGPVLAISAGYLALLFLLAFIVNRLAASQKDRLIGSPLIYTLSLSVYCTSWTFYGAVGSASRNGIEFLTIYLGPSLIFFGWWLLLRKLVRISKSQRITSLADFISSRYGKSTRLAALVTIMAVIGTTPYIALQLKAVASSFETITQLNKATGGEVLGYHFYADTGFWVAVAMAVFLVLFGTRSIGVDEYHHGVVATIAIESLVKLLAFIAVGIVVVLTLRTGEGLNLFEAMRNDPQLASRFTYNHEAGPRWLTMLILSAAAIICLPRQFQISIVEITDEKNLQTASWLFPLYLLLISLFVIPIAVAGSLVLPANADPDQFLLTVPMALGQEELTLLAFIGGFSSATSMMIVASMALSIMISNHLIMPVLLRLQHQELERSGDFTPALLFIRRISIIAILALGYIYYRFSTGSDALASIGLIAFAASAQFLPVLVGGVFWKNATERGAVMALVSGFGVWAFTLLAPVFERAGFISGILDNGLWGQSWLRPEALFGANGWDPLVHSLFWSYSANILVFIVVSLLALPKGLEKLQGTLFVDIFKHPYRPKLQLQGETVRSGELLALSQRFLGTERTREMFSASSKRQGVHGMPETDATLITDVEQQLAGSIGAASARVMVSRIASGEMIRLDQMIEILDETQQVIAYSHELEQKSKELEETTARLRAANDQLKRMDRRKDDFLSHVSHELRTPMTSIRSFSEILMEARDLDSKQQQHFLEIIFTETKRLTRLLDEILDISMLEKGYGHMQLQAVRPVDILRDAVNSVDGMARQKQVKLVDRSRASTWSTQADPDRLKQVYINILSNAVKFCDATEPQVEIDTQETTDSYTTIISDNGPGIPEQDHEAIFSKFERKRHGAQGSGLGLAISRQIINRMNGSIKVASSVGEGSAFSITIPRQEIDSNR